MMEDNNLPLSRVDEAKVMEWLQKGAQPTDTVRNLLAKIGTDEEVAAVRQKLRLLSLRRKKS
jgi:ribosomal protein S16